MRGAVVARLRWVVVTAVAVVAGGWAWGQGQPAAATSAATAAPASAAAAPGSRARPVKPGAAERKAAPPADAGRQPTAAGPAERKPPAPASAERKTAAEPPAGFRIAPAPAWVQPLAVDGAITLPAAPVHVLLADRQSRLGPQGTHRFVRSLRQINEAAGLAEASQLQVMFDPQNQQLVIHTAAIWRGEQRIDKLDSRQVRLYQRETQLERQMLDGRTTASILLDDVRVGDRVEWAFSILGDNPVFAGRFVDLDWTQSSLGPLALYQHRVLSPPGRTVQHRFGEVGIELRTAELAGERETVFVRRAAPQFVIDTTAPSRSWIPEVLQLSEFTDWADVAAWSAELFREAVQAGPEVKARAEAIRAQAATPAERLRLALDLVQTEVRYFGVEIGASSHRPAPAEKVLAQRYGDCKDKVALLVALLRELEIDATPVLVSSQLRRGVQELLPSPLAFDHVIARVLLEGKPLWVDGTRSHQRGPAAARQSHGLGFGLPTVADTKALAVLPDTADLLRAETTDTLRFDKLSQTGTLEVRQAFHGEYAEVVRGLLASRPRAEFDRHMVADYLRVYAGAQQDGELQLQEDDQRNAVVITARFRLPTHWRVNERQLLFGEVPMVSLLNVLRVPAQGARTRPLALQVPGIYRYRVQVQFGEPVFEKDAQGRVDEVNPFFELHLQTEGTRSGIGVDAELRQFGDAIEAADLPRYHEALTKVRPQLVLGMGIASVSPEQMRKFGSELIAMRERTTRAVRDGTMTGAQGMASLNVLLLKAQLDSDRLTPNLRARALLQRGMSLEMLTRYDEAVAEYQAALALQPDSGEAHANLSSCMLKMGRDDAALAHAVEAARLVPTSPWPRYAKGLAHHYRGEQALARAEFAELLKQRAEVERGQAALWLYVTTRELGGDGAAALKAAWPTGSRPAWPYPVLQWLDGRVTLEEAQKLAAAEAGARKARELQLYFFVAKKALLDGEVDRGREYLRRAVALGVSELSEHSFARRELDRLDKR